MKARVCAVVLAAGQSKRMGRPKMALPWGDTTVIGQVVQNLAAARLDEILVVTGSDREQVEAALQEFPVRFVHNPHYGDGEMLLSLQAGLSVLDESIQAVLIALGDQPQIQAGVVAAVFSAYRRSHASLVVPSYRMRRGHPWILNRSLWPSVLELCPPQTLRDLLHTYAEHIRYVLVDTPSIFQDLDTPEDYQRFKPPTSGSYHGRSKEPQ